MAIQTTDGTIVGAESSVIAPGMVYVSVRYTGAWLTLDQVDELIAALTAAKADATKKAKPKIKVGDLVVVDGYDASSDGPWEGEVGRVERARSNDSITIRMETGDWKGVSGAFDLKHLRVIGTAI